MYSARLRENMFSLPPPLQFLSGLFQPAASLWNTAEGLPYGDSQQNETLYGFVNLA